MCAVFNPQVQQGQDNMPDWTKVTKPVDSFVADKSLGTSLNTIGTGLEEGASIVDTQAKDIIKKDVRSTVEPIREDFTNTLVAARDQMNNSVVPAPAQTGQGGTMSLTNENQPVAAPPVAVKAGLDRVQSLQLAAENGKVNDTYYDMRLKSAVTDLRAKYPGYVDYIDSQVSAITGVNPANDLVQNLMQDINRMQSTKKSATDTAIEKTMSSGYPNSTAMIQKLQREGEAALPEYRNWYARETEFDANIKRRDAIRQYNKGTKADIADSRESDYQNLASAKASSYLDALITIPGVTTPAKVLDIMADAAANPNKYSDEQMRMLALRVQAQQTQYETEMRREAMSVSKDADGRSYSFNSDIGSTKTEATIKNMANTFQTIRDALNKGGPDGLGLAYAHAIHAKAILDGNKDDLLTDKDLGWYATNLGTMRELYGDQYVNTATLAGLKDKIDQKMAARLQNDKTAARLGFDVSGNPVTATDHLERAQQLEAQGKITAGMRARYTDNMVNLIDDIKNPKAPQNAKEQIVRYMFGTPEGQGVLTKLKTDYTDPVTNKFVSGKYSAFTRFTSEDIVNEVKKMSPEVQAIYKNYLEREAGSELFQKEMLNLNHFTGHDNLHFRYNDGGAGGLPQIELVNDAGALESPVGKTVKPGMINENQRPNQGYLFQVQKIVDRTNQALAGMSRMEKAFGGNANDYILDFLVNKARVDLGTNWEGLPAKLVEAIAASRAPKRRIEDTFKNLGNNK